MERLHSGKRTVTSKILGDSNSEFFKVDVFFFFRKMSVQEAQKREAEQT